MRLSATQMAGIVLLAMMIPKLASADEPPASGPWTPVGLALWDPVGFIGSNEDIVGISVNILYGSSHSMSGIEAGLVNHTEKLVGIQLGFVANSDKDVPFGLQAGGIFNDVDNGHGLQLAGFGNVAEKSYVGLQLTTLANLVSGPADALQTALINNVEGDFHGLQIGFMNWDGSTIPVPVGPERCDGSTCTQQMTSTTFPDSRVIGAQLGFMNVSEHFAGLSVGATNIVASDAGGAMIGLVNVAHDVTGIQIGLINVAHGLRGIQLGAINVATDNALPFMVIANAGL